MVPAVAPGLRDTTNPHCCPRNSTTLELCRRDVFLHAQDFGHNSDALHGCRCRDYSSELGADIRRRHTHIDDVCLYALRSRPSHHFNPERRRPLHGCTHGLAGQQRCTTTLWLYHVDQHHNDIVRSRLPRMQERQCHICRSAMSHGRDSHHAVDGCWGIYHLGVCVLRNTKA